MRTEDHPLEYARLRGRDPGRELRRGRDDRVGPRHLPQRSTRSAPARGPRGRQARSRARGPQAARALRAGAHASASGGRDWLLLHKGARERGGPSRARRSRPRCSPASRSRSSREGDRRDARARAALPRELGAPQRALDRDALRPMLARTRRTRRSRAPGWLFELKYDGVRALAREGRRRAVRLRRAHRRRRDATSTPRSRARVAHLPLASCVLDGEVVALDERGRSSFERIQRRFTQSDPRGDRARRASRCRSCYYAFDLLGRARPRPARAPARSRARSSSRASRRARGFVRFADHVEGDGERALRAARRARARGRDREAGRLAYESGRRTPELAQDEGAAHARASRSSAGRPGKGIARALGALLLAGRATASWSTREASAPGSTRRRSRRCCRGSRPRARREAAVSPACPIRPPRGARCAGPSWSCEVRYTRGDERGAAAPAGLPRAARRRRAVEACLAPARRAAHGVAEPARAARRAARPRGAEAELAAHAARQGLLAVEGYTKGDLLAYYEAVWPWLAPYLRDRPVVLTRYPDGIEGKNFFQKNAPDFTPDWVRASASTTPTTSSATSCARSST